MENSNQNKEPAHYGLFIARMVTINLVVLLLVTVYSNVTRRSQVKRIEDAAVLARAKSEAIEQQLLEYMARTVQRWDSLQKLNRDLIIPSMSEPQPIGTKALPPIPFLVRTPTPTPTATIAPKPKVRTVIKYRKVRTPTPRPFFHW